MRTPSCPTRRSLGGISILAKACPARPPAGRSLCCALTPLSRAIAQLSCEFSLESVVVLRLAMLIQFRVENHRSLRDEAVLSLNSASGEGLQGAGLSLLPAVALYGANASGKSNVLQALRFMRDAVVNSHRRWEPDGGVPTEPFALSSKKHEPSLYEIDAVINGDRVRYGFVVSAKRVDEEWLHVWPSGKKQVWFEREGDDFEFGRKLHGDNAAIRGLTRDNSLFVAVAAQNNHQALTPIFRWFRTIQINAPRIYSRGFAPGPFLAEMFSKQLGLFDEDSEARDRDAVLELLKVADTGIIDVRIGEADDRMYTRGLRRRTQLQFRHKSEEHDDEGSWLPLEVESAGTVALIELAPRLSAALRNGNLVCLDEMEASLHPMLAVALLRLFQDPKRNPRGAQLLFTTHDTNLLGTIHGEPALRRDQIWFTEKDTAGATHLYPLTDFQPRKQENLERGYLQGRYGAVPFIGDLLPLQDEKRSD